eukprot:Rhum_TRINITY_DN14154_c9_g1::Rhum_TRINITY_DN14154_c9_g1_i1::g.70987::m.70987
MIAHRPGREGATAVDAFVAVTASATATGGAGAAAGVPSLAVSTSSLSSGSASVSFAGGRSAGFAGYPSSSYTTCDGRFGRDGLSIRRSVEKSTTLPASLASASRLLTSRSDSSSFASSSRRRACVFDVGANVSLAARRDANGAPDAAGAAASCFCRCCCCCCCCRAFSLLFSSFISNAALRASSFRSASAPPPAAASSSSSSHAKPSSPGRRTDAQSMPEKKISGALDPSPSVSLSVSDALQPSPSDGRRARTSSSMLRRRSPRGRASTLCPDGRALPPNTTSSSRSSSGTAVAAAAAAAADDGTDWKLTTEHLRGQLKTLEKKLEKKEAELRDEKTESKSLHVKVHDLEERLAAAKRSLQRHSTSSTPACASCAARKHEAEELRERVTQLEGRLATKDRELSTVSNRLSQQPQADPRLLDELRRQVYQLKTDGDRKAEKIAELTEQCEKAHDAMLSAAQKGFEFDIKLHQARSTLVTMVENERSPQRAGSGARASKSASASPKQPRTLPPPQQSPQQQLHQAVYASPPRQQQPQQQQYAPPPQQPVYGSPQQYQQPQQQQYQQSPKVRTPAQYSNSLY